MAKIFLISLIYIYIIVMKENVFFWIRVEESQVNMQVHMLWTLRSSWLKLKRNLRSLWSSLANLRLWDPTWHARLETGAWHGEEMIWGFFSCSYCINICCSTLCIFYGPENKGNRKECEQNWEYELREHESKQERNPFIMKTIT